jgi:N-acylneuraminate cytidylyltransferase
MKPTIYAFIFARGGSKGVPGKNIRLLAGKPLIAYAIEVGIRCEMIDRIFVSTENGEIADVSRRHGAEVPFLRPAELAQDDTPEWIAWQHAISEIQDNSDTGQMDIFVSLPPTSPFRTVGDIEACIRSLCESDADMVITVKNSNRHPSFNMVILDQNGYTRLVMPLKKTVHRRQDVHPVFDMTTVAYVTRPDFVMNADEPFAGRTRAVVIPEERALDIDTEFDFTLAELLAAKLSKG